jgi:hypothetical protein
MRERIVVEAGRYQRDSMPGILYKNLCRFPTQTAQNPIAWFSTLWEGQSAYSHSLKSRARFAKAGEKTGRIAWTSVTRSVARLRWRPTRGN